MFKHEDCNPSERFLQALFVLSDETLKAWKQEAIRRCKGKELGAAYNNFVNWKRQENEIAVFTAYAYAEFSIPRQFDYVFSYSSPENHVNSKFILTQSILEGWYPMDCVERGHKHLCILAFEKEIPGMFGQLHYETSKYSSWTWDEERVLGLCQLSDIQSIIDRRQEENRLRKIYGDNWREFYDNELSGQ